MAYCFVEIEDVVIHIHLDEHLLHVFVGTKEIESADVFDIGDACRILPIVIYTLAEMHFSGVKIMQSSGVVVAVRPACVIIRETPMNISPYHVHSMNGPVERQTESGIAG